VITREKNTNNNTNNNFLRSASEMHNPAVFVRSIVVEALFFSVPLVGQAITRRKSCQGPKKKRRIWTDHQSCVHFPAIKKVVFALFINMNS